MAKFTTRIELHELRNGKKPEADTYEKLHKAMEAKGFSRYITYGDITYHMPTAEYNRSVEKESKLVLADAVNAAKTVWEDFSVLVTETTTSRQQHNLKKK